MVGQVPLRSSVAGAIGIDRHDGQIASAVKSKGALATSSFSQKWAIAVEISGSAVVMIASTGEMRMPA
jgi:hypothetical protein